MSQRPSVKSTKYGNNNPEPEDKRKRTIQEQKRKQIHKNFDYAKEHGVLKKAGHTRPTSGGKTIQSITVEQVPFRIIINDDIKPELIKEILSFSYTKKKFTNGTDFLNYIIPMKEKGKLQFLNDAKYENNNPEGKPQKRSILQQIQQNFHEADEKGVLEKVGQNTETLGGMTITVEQVVFTIIINDDMKPELINEILSFSIDTKDFTNGTDFLKYIIDMKKEGKLQFLNISSSGLDTKIDAMFKDIILITNSFERLLQRELNELDQDSSEKNQNEIKFLTTYIELLDIKNKAGEISSEERKGLEEEQARIAEEKDVNKMLNVATNSYRWNG